MLPNSAEHKENFYPRSPRGERLGHLPVIVPARAISIHAPREGSDCASVVSLIICSTDFYPRSPRGERPPDGRDRAGPKNEFLSTLPARGATTIHTAEKACSTISIHAPREGSDPMVLMVDRLNRGISIHAPREGSDGKTF